MTNKADKDYEEGTLRIYHGSLLRWQHHKLLEDTEIERLGKDADVRERENAWPKITPFDPDIAVQSCFTLQIPKQSP